MLRLTSLAGENGSCLRVTESTATPRVELSSLIRTGRVDCALEWKDFGGEKASNIATHSVSRAKHQPLRDNLAAVRAAIAALIRVMGSLVNLSPIVRTAKHFFRGQSCRDFH